MHLFSNNSISTRPSVVQGATSAEPLELAMELMHKAVLNHSFPRAIMQS